MAPSSTGRQDRSQLGASVRKDRDALFHGRAHHGHQRKGMASTSTASEAQAIQQSLKNTQILLKNELRRVAQVATAIDDDGKLLEDTKKHQQSLNVSGAKSALTSLQRAQQQEQRVLMASVIFFFYVVVYIMWCRILVKLPFVERILGIVLSSVEDLLKMMKARLFPLSSDVLDLAMQVYKVVMQAVMQGSKVAKEAAKPVVAAAIETYKHFLAFSKQQFEALTS